MKLHTKFGIFDTKNSSGFSWIWFSIVAVLIVGLIVACAFV